MSLTADQGGKVAGPDTREVIVEFSPAAVRAPFALRCAALFIDYIVIVAVPVLGLVFDKLVAGDQAKLSNNTAWLIAIILGLSDLIIFPALSGQSLGMMISGLRVVRMDGGAPSALRIILRNTAGYFLTLLTLGLGFALAVITPNGRTLHDYISGTMVIFANKRRL